MTREEVIKKAAEHYAELVDKEYDISPRIKQIVKSAYQVGAEWADSNPVNVWHKADEEPANKDAIILCLSKYMVRPLSYKCSWLIDHIESWENAVKNLSITHWLYLEDIIPEDYRTDYENNLLWMAKLKK